MTRHLKQACPINKMLFITTLWKYFIQHCGTWAGCSAADQTQALVKIHFVITHVFRVLFLASKEHIQEHTLTDLFIRKTTLILGRTSFCSQYSLSSL